MKMKLTSMAVAGLMAASPVLADLVFPSMSYRTGPYAAGGIPFADGYADYFTMLNARDGGIGGVMTSVPECETAYNTEKGVECYESLKGGGGLVYQPLSTGITYQLIPKTTVDDIPMHTMGYGRTSAKNGEVFTHTFNYPANYWDGASGAINYLLAENGGDLNGKKISLVYHNSAYGKEPIRTLTDLAAKHGFEFTEVPVDHPGQEQKSQWLQIRRDKPDYVIMYGWGVMNQVAIQEAVNIRFPMENFIGVWWSGSENDVLAAGAGANGYKALTFHGVGKDFPVFADIQTHVVDAGKAAGAGDQIGTVLYNRGLYAAMLAAEAAKTAQEIHGVAQINASQMRDGMAALEITEEKMAALGLPNFGPSFKVSCDNHGGDGMVGVTQWDATAKTWTLISDFAETDKELIDGLIAEDSAAYAAENNITPECK
ncbi:ABC transporter substrate-binding protein [Sulfitobacter guttiformis]|uniref:Amino acid/amide ABC transporter substrate-binding protein (HAAT family) n=1 Tax=Sulfitobacter guttiformis TaxID=74349 RepID=A0A420DT76_9RHOB|nr:ABC transporter substrate-binding protein [Sulfitobacter guttiformis]KIN74796.1 Branched-chain amino acid ABC transporter, periplasmic branched-chain amino acid binding protein [Sulfitobacter guttiformis KCTC 32187]RKE97368.1 amino acid/amide ABC transporter substrate-binding protein (HAAT family) [Sulfitobacter guttiformis]